MAPLSGSRNTSFIRFWQMEKFEILPVFYFRHTSYSNPNHKKKLNNNKLWKLFLFLKFIGFTFTPKMKDKILHKAAELFLSHGFKSVTMDDIATEMGISKKTIYKHFTTKTALVVGVSSHLFEIISKGIDEIRLLKKDPIEEMYEIKKFVMCHLKGEKASPIFQLQKYYPAIFKTIKQKQLEKMQGCMSQNLERGIKKGLYRNNMNLKFITRIYFLGMNGIKDESIFPKNEFSHKEIHEEYLSYHLRGIVTPKGLEKLNQIIMGSPPKI